MSADVIPFDPKAAETEAWEKFQAHASRMIGNQKLVLDRDYMAEHARLHERWRKLFLRIAL